MEIKQEVIVISDDEDDEVLPLDQEHQDENGAHSSGKYVGNASKRPKRTRKYLHYAATCYATILEMFPDASHRYLNEQCDTVLRQPPPLNEGEEHTLETLCEAIVSEILGNGRYPKQRDTSEEKASRKRAASTSSSADEAEKWQYGRYGYPVYDDTALLLLQTEFPYIPVAYVRHIYVSKESLYLAYLELARSDRENKSLPGSPYKRLVRPRRYASLPNLGSNVRKTPFEQRIMKELVDARARIRKETARLKQEKDKIEALRLANEEHIKAGDVVECQICFDEEVPFDMATFCDADTPHFFCITCVKTYAESQVGQSRYEMKCVSSDQCTGSISRDQLQRCIGPKTLAALERNQQRAEINDANIEGLEECPFCSFKAIYPPVDVNREFRCLNPRCEIVSCRLCHHETHIPLTCEEAEKESAQHLRHGVEEAMTNAVIRRCPKCKTPAIKTDGCNKITCQTCRTLFCYLCRKDISIEAYAHFSSKRNTCIVSDFFNIDMIHQGEAEAAEKEAIQKARAKNPRVSEDELHVKMELPASTAPSSTTEAANPNRIGQWPFDRIRRRQVLPAQHGPHFFPRLVQHFPMDFPRLELGQQDFRLDIQQPEPAGAERRPGLRRNAAQPAEVPQLDFNGELNEAPAQFQAFARQYLDLAARARRFLEVTREHRE